MIRTVLFDLDDTLVAKKARQEPRWWRGRLTFTEQRRARTREFLALDLDDKAADDMFAGYLSRYEAGWSLFDDAVPALRRARSAGLSVAIFTNGDENQQRHKLRVLGQDKDVQGALRVGLDAVLVDRRREALGVDVARVTSLDELHFDSASPRVLHA